MKKQEAKRTGVQCVSVSLPELLQLSQYADQLSLSALHIKSPQAGQQHSLLLGRGMEFAQSRRYQAGDDIRHIDWNITARTGKAHTKLFSAEKERQILLCGDMRSSMLFATRGLFKSVQAALMMGHLAWTAVKSGDRLGGVLFDDKDHCEFRPARGKRGVLPFLQGLAEKSTYSPSKRDSSSVITMDRAMEGMQRVASPGSLIFVISDFRHFSTHLRDMLIQLGRHSDLCLCFIYDPLEAAWPKQGIYPVHHQGNELQLNTADRRNREKYQMQFIERREKVKSIAGIGHIHFIECSTEENCFEKLKEHFRCH